MATVTGYVAFIDVLGFAAMVLSGQYLTALRKYRQAIATALGGQQRVSYLVFSDSVVLYSADTESDAFWHILARTGKLFRELTLSGFPLRGCVSSGHFEMADPASRTNVIAGPALSEAHENEQKQNWVGVMLAPSVLKVMGTNINQWTGPGSTSAGHTPSVPWVHLVHDALIPFRGMEGTYQGKGVLPVSSDSRDSRTVIQELSDARSALIEMRWLAPDPVAQAKYGATVDWLKTAMRSIGQQR